MGYACVICGVVFEGHIREHDCIAALRAEVGRLEARLVDESECIHCGEVTDQTDLNHWETCAEHPARQKVAELESALRPAEGLPTWRELVESDIQQLSDCGRSQDFRTVMSEVFNITEDQSKQLCAALGRDPETGEKRGEE